MKRIFLTVISFFMLFTNMGTGVTRIYAEGNAEEIAAAEQAVAEAEAAYKKGSLGFFEWHNDSGSQAVTIINDRLASQANDDWGNTELGADNDATSLTNLERAINMVRTGNELRASDEHNSGDNKKPLKITDTMMAIAEVQCNASAAKQGHSQFYEVGENISWGSTNGYDGWYGTEKKVYDWFLANPDKSISNAADKQECQQALGLPSVNHVQTGHYLNIANPDNQENRIYQTTGFAWNSGPNFLGYPPTQGQTFGWDYYGMGAKGTIYTVDEYAASFAEYKQLLDDNLAAAQARLEAARAGGTTDPEKVTSITLDNTSLSLTVGGTQQLTATVLPEDAADKSITWSSSDTAVATVNNGLVTAVSAGTATITAAANDGSGVSAQCTVTVTASSTTDPVYTIRYVIGDDAYWEGEAPQTEYVYPYDDNSHPVLDIEPKKEGHRFWKWRAVLESDPDTVIASFFSVEVFPAITCGVPENGVVIMTPSWEPITYRLTLHPNGGTFTLPADPQVTLDDGCVITRYEEQDDGTVIVRYTADELKNKTIYLPGGANSDAGLTKGSKLLFWHAAEDYSDTSFTTLSELYTTQGWSTDEPRNADVYAQWKALYEVHYIINVDPSEVTFVTYPDMAGGSYPDGYPVSSCVGDPTPVHFSMNREGYTLKGWAVSQEDANNGVVTYQDDQLVNTCLATEEGQIIYLYAVWEESGTAADTWTLKYELDEGAYFTDGRSLTQTFGYDQEWIDLGNSAVAKEGVVLKGWNIYKENGEFVTNVGVGTWGGTLESYFYPEKGGTLIVKPEWEKVVTVTVHFILNNEGAVFANGETDYTGYYENVPFSNFYFGDAVAKKDGEILDGWAETPDAETACDMQELAAKISDQNLKTITVYGVWRPAWQYRITYTVDPSEGYFLDNGTKVYEKTQYMYEEEPWIPNDVILKEYPVSTRDGYVFVGWNVKQSNGEIFNRPMLPGQFKYTLDDGLDLAEKDADGVYVLNLVAVWKEGDTYTATLHLNGGRLVNDSGLTKINDDTYTFTFSSSGNLGTMLPNSNHWKTSRDEIVKSGNKFLNWRAKTTDPETGEEIYTRDYFEYDDEELHDYILHDVDLYAFWEEINYHLVYVSTEKEVQFINGDVTQSWGPALASYHWDDDVLVNQEVLRNGYTLEGWATSRANAEKGIVAYKNGQSAGKLFADLDPDESEIKLYTVWKENTQEHDSDTIDIKYVIDPEEGHMTYHGAVLNTYTDYFTKDESDYYVITARPESTRAGYVFAGWVVEDDPRQILHSAGGQVGGIWSRTDVVNNAKDGTLTLHAVFKEGTTYTATLHLRGGRLNNVEGLRYVDDETYEYTFSKYDVQHSPTLPASENATFKAPWTIHRPGFTFRGWTKDESVVSGQGSDTLMPGMFEDSENYHDIDVYAIWEGETYTATLHLNGGALNKDNGAVKVNDSTYTFTFTAQDVADGFALPEDPKGRMEKFIIETPETGTPDWQISRAAHLFGGWTIASSADVYRDSRYFTLSEEMFPNGYGDIDLYAGWVDDMYKITYDVNKEGAQLLFYASPGETNYNYYTLNQVVRFNYSAYCEGYTFMGWAASKADAEAGIVSYKTGDGTYPCLSKHGEDVTVYAVWMEAEKAQQITDMVYYDEIPDQQYTGKAITPKINIYDAGRPLTQGKDYTLKFKNNKNAGTAEVIVTMKGNYTGKKTINFKILPVSLPEFTSVEPMSVKLTGKKLSPVPTVTWNGTKLKNKKDFTVRYMNNDTGKAWDQKTEAGFVIAVIEGKGNFEGTTGIPITIIEKSSALKPVSKLKVTIKNMPYEEDLDQLGDVLKTLQVRDGKTLLTENTDYIVHTDGVNIDRPGTYTLTIEGIGNYAGFRNVTFKMTGVSLTDKNIKVNTPVLEYVPGEEGVKPADEFKLTHKVNGVEITLVRGEDYEIIEQSYRNNTNAGTGSVEILGMGGYTGTRTLKFKITPKKEVLSAENNVVILGDTAYTKGGVKPEVEVTDLSGNVLTLNKDYTVKYGKNNKANTTGTLTVTFKGNYKGTTNLTKEFAIGAKPISDVTAAAKDVLSSNKAGKFRSTPVLTDTDGKKLKAGTDYEKTFTYQLVSMSGDVLEDLTAKSVVTAADSSVWIKVTITGKGNYAGTVSAWYKVLPAGHDISKSTFKIKDQVYTGDPIALKPEDITVTKGNKELVCGRDYYILSYKNNVKTGKASVILQGANPNFGGTKTVTFKIVKKGVTDKNWLGPLFTN